MQFALVHCAMRQCIFMLLVVLVFQDLPAVFLWCGSSFWLKASFRLTVYLLKYRVKSWSTRRCDDSSFALLASTFSFIPANYEGKGWQAMQRWIYTQSVTQSRKVYYVLQVCQPHIERHLSQLTISEVVLPHVASSGWQFAVDSRGDNTARQTGDWSR